MNGKRKISKPGSGPKGWTLLETTVALVVFSLLGLVLAVLYSSGDTMVQVSNIKLSLQQEARLGLDRMLKELRQARSASITINQNQNSISFEVPASIDTNSGAITWSSTITYSVGGINNAQLLRTQVGSAATTVLANNVNNNPQDPNRLQFAVDQQANPGGVTVTLGLTRSTLAGFAANTVLVGEAKVRNP